MDQVLNLAPIALLAFGCTWVVDFLLKKYTKVVFDTQAKLIVCTVFAFIFSFIPVEFQNEVVNRIRDAIAITVGITAIYQGGKNIRG